MSSHRTSHGCPTHLSKISAASAPSSLYQVDSSGIWKNLHPPSGSRGVPQNGQALNRGIQGYLGHLVLWDRTPNRSHHHRFGDPSVMLLNDRFISMGFDFLSRTSKFVEILLSQPRIIGTAIAAILEGFRL